MNAIPAGGKVRRGDRETTLRNELEGAAYALDGLLPLLASELRRPHDAALLDLAAAADLVAAHAQRLAMFARRLSDEKSSCADR
jgi:hypothetical protein